MSGTPHTNGHDIDTLGPDDDGFWDYYIARATEYQTRESTAGTSAKQQPVPELIFARDVQFNPRVTAPLKGVIEKGDVGAAFGPSGVGKTFVLMDGCMAIARGDSHWCGRRIKAGAVLYVAFEGGRMLEHRVLAARMRHGDPGAGFALHHARTPLNRACGAQGVAAIVAAAKALEVEAESQVALTVIDTLSAAAAGDDENSASDMSLVVDRLKAIAHATGAAVCVVHHTGKDVSRGLRGSGALKGNLDFVIEVEEGGSVTIDKSRDHAELPLASFDLEVVELGTDDDGDPATSCVVRWRPATQPNMPERKEAKLSASAKKALEMLRRLYIAGQAVDVPLAEIDLAGVPPDRQPKVVTLDAWRSKCREARLSESTAKSAEPTAFKRAVEALESAGIVARYGDFAWLTDQRRHWPEGAP